MSFKDKILQRQQEENVNRAIEESESLPDNDNDLEEARDFKFFGIESTRNYPPSIDLRLSNGKARFLAYSLIVDGGFDASTGIEVITATKRITIEGRNLKRLYDYLVAYRVKYIQANLGNDVTDEDALFIKDIKIEDI